MSRSCWLIMLLMLLAPFVALAQDEPAATGEDSAAADQGEAALAEEAAAPAEPATYSRYDATEFGFSTELPDSGVITDPSSPDWNEDAASAFKWQATGDEPIQLIIGRVDTLNTEIDDLTFSIICGTMLDSWKEDSTMYKVITDNEPVVIEGDGPNGQRNWNLIEIEDLSHGADQPVYYSVFSTYSGENVYSIMMYYLKPVSPLIRSFGIPVIHEFRMLKEANGA